MGETKQYEVVEPIALEGVEKAVGEVVDLTDEQAAEFGAAVKLKEETAAGAGEGSDNA